MIWLEQQKLDDAIGAIRCAIKEGMREVNTGHKIAFHVEDKMIQAAVLGALVTLTNNSVLMPEGTMLVSGFGNGSPVTWPADGGKAYRAHKAGET